MTLNMAQLIHYQIMELSIYKPSSELSNVILNQGVCVLELRINVVWSLVHSI